MSITTDAQRIQLIIDYSKMSRRALGIKLGYSDGTFLFHLLNGRNGISAKLAKNITDKFPELNYNWIIKGEGTMLVEPKVDPVNSVLLKRVDILERISEGQDARIKLQSLEINAQATRIENLETLFDTKKNLMPQSF